MQAPGVELDLMPLQVADLGGSHPVKDCRRRKLPRGWSGQLLNRARRRVCCILWVANCATFNGDVQRELAAEAKAFSRVAFLGAAWCCMDQGITTMRITKETCALATHYWRVFASAILNSRD